jgi:hypothetical protein
MAAKRAPTASSTVGYSGKALWQKLGLTSGQRLYVHNPVPQIDALLTGAPAGIVRLPRLAAFDVALAFATKRAESAGALAKLLPHLQTGGMIWFAWPKKTSGVATDITEDALRSIVLPTGLVDVKVCAIDATWSGLKFLRRRVT